MVIPMSRFVFVASSDYSAFDEHALPQPFVLFFLADFAIVHLLRSIYPRTNSIVCRLANFIPNYFLITALMRRIPALLLSSLTILKLIKSPVLVACGPPQISVETSPIR